MCCVWTCKARASPTADVDPSGEGHGRGDAMPAQDWRRSQDCPRVLRFPFLLVRFWLLFFVHSYPFCPFLLVSSCLSVFVGPFLVVPFYLSVSFCPFLQGVWPGSGPLINAKSPYSVPRCFGSRLAVIE
jgi:hypothetical protein